VGVITIRRSKGAKMNIRNAFSLADEMVTEAAKQYGEIDLIHAQDRMNETDDSEQAHDCWTLEYGTFAFWFNDCYGSTHIVSRKIK
jgi:hypothetical protein